ncbi:hypothetical protein CF319_g7286 [Tilletia indica]|nr:hypothetical protein CF319_g7286 [Tilletia indica]KAE8227719.1 hypothetical protein CF326_g7376 [Tilletia indica]
MPNNGEKRRLKRQAARGQKRADAQAAVAAPQSGTSSNFQLTLPTPTSANPIRDPLKANLSNNIHSRRTRRLCSISRKRVSKRYKNGIVSLDRRETVRFLFGLKRAVWVPAFGPKAKIPMSKKPKQIKVISSLHNSARRCRFVRMESAKSKKYPASSDEDDSTDEEDGLDDFVVPDNETQGSNNISFYLRFS